MLEYVSGLILNSCVPANLFFFLWYLFKYQVLRILKRSLFLTNHENHNLDTRQRNNLYLPQANLTIYQKEAYYPGIKIFNNLPLEIKNVSDNQK